MKLGVNIDHVATLREARHKGSFSDNVEPSPLAAAKACVEAGAHSITAHLREDRRHIQAGDVLNLRKELKVPLNLEMAVTEPMIDFALKLHPDEACLVPEKREEVTTEGGLNVWKNEKKIASCVKRLSQEGIRVSLFIDPEERSIQSSVNIGAPCVELHTGQFANALSDKEREKKIKELTQAANLAHEKGLQVNAGHGLNYKNISHLLDVPHLNTLNIGHSIVSRSIFVGMEQAVKEMLDLIKDYHG